ncbi:hypothetical protein LshimejAT787_1002000 [Lyophyllum shimeji]|uniref:Uncharacterized protein n=1 Tax=Lyophyllum shimeji TaxID=47721 RepID=A0A9P3PT92_LYOSH|nr:hypothetical protein LshimejAT787_1002000 [Lyophyllum shimeji]
MTLGPHRKTRQEKAANDEKEEKRKRRNKSRLALSCWPISRPIPPAYNPSNEQKPCRTIILRTIEVAAHCSPPVVAKYVKITTYPIVLRLEQHLPFSFTGWIACSLHSPSGYIVQNN